MEICRDLFGGRMAMRKVQGIVFGLTGLILVLAAGGGYYLASNWTEQTVVTDIAQYEDYFGSSGIHRNQPVSQNTVEGYLIPSDIFPESLPETADVEDFYYEYLNRWDPCYLAYLVYGCAPDDYEKELARLTAIPSEEKYLIYGAESFAYDIAAVNASDWGYIYALVDKANLRFIYVELTFCDYFTDIDYEAVIPPEFLPEGFDAGRGNPTRLKWESDRTLPMDEAATPGERTEGKSDI